MIFVVLPASGVFAGTGLTYDQVTNYLKSQIHMERSTDVRGQARYMGSTADKMAMLEIVGSKSDVTQATLILGIPNDAPEKLVLAGAMLLRFVKNVGPEQSGNTDWVTPALERVIANPDRNEERIIGGRIIRMSFLKPLGMLMITVESRR